MKRKNSKLDLEPYAKSVRGDCRYGRRPTHQLTLIVNLKERKLGQYLRGLTEEFGPMDSADFDQSVFFVRRLFWGNDFTQLSVTYESSGLITGYSVHLYIVFSNWHGQKQIGHIRGIQAKLVQPKLVVCIVCTKRLEAWTEYAH